MDDIDIRVGGSKNKIEKNKMESEGQNYDPLHNNSLFETNKALVLSKDGPKAWARHVTTSERQKKNAILLKRKVTSDNC